MTRRTIEFIGLQKYIHKMVEVNNDNAIRVP